MRIFIAIELSEEIRNSLALIQTHLKYSGADVKWVEKDNIHLTLKFLGDINDEKCELVKSALDKIAKSTRPFGISIKDIGAFPNIDYPRVIWVGLDKGANESKTLAVNINEELSKIGFQKDSRPFAPHLTIGRVRSPKNKAALKEKMLGYEFSAVSSQRIDSMFLFQSTLTPKGPVYAKLLESSLLTT